MKITSIVFCLLILTSCSKKIKSDKEVVSEAIELIEVKEVSVTSLAERMMRNKLFVDKSYLTMDMTECKNLFDKLPELTDRNFCESFKGKKLAQEFRRFIFNNSIEIIQEVNKMDLSKKLSYLGVAKRAASIFSASVINKEEYELFYKEMSLDEINKDRIVEYRKLDKKYGFESLIYNSFKFFIDQSIKGKLTDLKIDSEKLAREMALKRMYFTYDRLSDSDELFLNNLEKDKVAYKSISLLVDLANMYIEYNTNQLMQFLNKNKSEERTGRISKVFFNEFVLKNTKYSSSVSL